MHLYSSLLRKCQHHTKQLWRGFSHRTEGGLWPQKGVLPYFLASQPLLMPGGPLPQRSRKFAPFYRKANYQILTFHAPLPLGSGASPKPLSSAQHPRP